MSQITRTLVPMAIVVAGSIWSSTAQALVVTTAISGTILTGFDGLGIFGPTDGILDGLSFSQTVSTDLAQGYHLEAVGASPLMYYVNPANASFNGSTQVGASNFQWTVSHTRGEFGMFNWGTHGIAQPDQIYLSMLSYDGRTPDGSQLVTENHIISWTQPFLTSQDPTQRLTLNANYLETATLFYLKRDDMATYWVSTPVLSRAALNPIPEPETWAMLVTGIGMLGFLARRRARLAA